VGDCGLDYVAQCRDKWGAVVYTVMNIRLPKSAGSLFHVHLSGFALVRESNRNFGT
jgi:hypothetical protein